MDSYLNARVIGTTKEIAIVRPYGSSKTHELNRTIPPEISLELSKRLLEIGDEIILAVNLVGSEVKLRVTHVIPPENKRTISI